MTRHASPLTGHPSPITPIRMVILDVDGVLTDGSILYDDHGVETKRFNVRDGFAMRAAPSLGLKVGVLTSRASRCVTLRMNELEVAHYLPGSKDKRVGFETLCAQANVQPENVAYLGDDLVDLPALLRCGYPMAVADAAEQVRGVARYVTRAPGGRGAAREAIELLLRTQGRWDELLERFGL